jgi:hypothetical protein
MHRSPRRSGLPVRFAVDFTLQNLEQRTLLAAAIGDDIPMSAFIGHSAFVFGSEGKFLSKRSSASPLGVVRSWLRDHSTRLGISAADANNSLLTDQYTDRDSGITHLYFRQLLNGLEIANADLSAHVMPDGRLLSIGGTFVPGPGSAAYSLPTPSLPINTALARAATQLGMPAPRNVEVVSSARGTAQVTTLRARDVSLDDIPARLQYAQTPDGLRLSWQFVLRTPDQRNWWDASVDAASGDLLVNTNWTRYFAQTGEYERKRAEWLANPVTYPAPPNAQSPGASMAGSPEAPIYSASYNVYARPLKNPDQGPRTIQNNPWDLVPSPRGWHDTDNDAGAETNNTTGNNVSAQEDVDANNTGGFRPTGGTLNPDGSGSLSFNFPVDLTQAPSTYQAAAITNLFYWNNVIHDVHYKYGFTEAAGNFQLNNYGLGGAQNDPVQADAQDGSGTNNANFSTPPDGSSGRMQMFLFTAPEPDRDGDFDNQVILHEYGHGVSNRLTGGPANSSALGTAQSGGMGEGWSDWHSLMLLQTDGSAAAQQAAYPVGTYVLAQPLNGPGIRRKPYSFNMAINNQTLGLYNGASVHQTGELWCGVLWDMNWRLINKYGFNPDVTQGFGPGSNPVGNGNLLAMRLVMDAMKLQPANPSFIQARDAIFAADNALTGGQNTRELWLAFARRGWGVSASTASSSSTTVTESFDVPAALFDPFIASATPNGTANTPALTTISFNFAEPVNPASFAVLDDINSFTGPGGVNLLSSITGHTFTNGNRTLNLLITAPTTDGTYTLSIGPNITAADNGAPMDQNLNGIPGEPSDLFVHSFVLDRFPGPDGAGYEASPTPFQTIDLVAGQPGVSVVVNGTDDGNGTLTLPAGNTFRYYNTNFTSMTVSANGLITFGGSTTSANNSDLTSTPSMRAIAVLWDDWRTDTNGTGSGDSAVLWKIEGNNLIIEWSEVPHFNAAGNPATFQAILRLNSGIHNGDIIYNYTDLNVNNASFNNGASASVGIKDTGTQGPNRILVSQNSGTNPFVGEGKAIRITTASIKGRVYHDYNTDGTFNGSDVGIPDVVVYVDANNNNALDTGENATLTDSSGNYALTSLTEGSNLVRRILPTNWIPITPASVNRVLAHGEPAIGEDFAVFNTNLVGTGGNDSLTVELDGSGTNVVLTPSFQPVATFPKTLLTSLNFDALGGASDSLVIDSANGNPLVNAGGVMGFKSTAGSSLMQLRNGTNYAFSADPSVDTPHLALSLLGNSSATFNAGVTRLASLGLDLSSATLTAGAGRVLVTRSLVLTNGSSLDLSDNDMVIDYTGASPATTIAGYLGSGRAAGAWNGAGINSSAAAGNALQNTGLGMLEASQYAGGTFSGVAIDSTAILVKYTYNGDTDLNGVVDFDDYARIDTGFLGGGSSWFEGDSDYNGVIDFDDYALIDAAFVTQGAPL